jgi:hypothetical protein
VATGGAWRPPAVAPGAPPPPPTFAVPSAVMRLLRGGGGGGGDVEQRADLGDGGWMLRALSPAGEAAQAGFVRASAEGRFLVFLADAF